MSVKNTRITEEDALKYHEKGGKPGKIAITPTKPLFSQRDLSLAYSPGVAFPCEHIAKDPDAIYRYTSKGNMVAVISNGTAVLGLGHLGAAASKPVMEGKAVLFKKFADIDAIDVEVDTTDPEEFINTVKNLGSSWGGINLEDIKAPECFIIERELKKLMDIPVFHDDQHGTAIITAAGMINAAHITKRDFANMKVVVNGAGAAAIACIELLKMMGISHQNVILCDTRGVIYKGRTDGMNEWKEKHAVETNLRTLAEAMVGADVFLGLSVKDAVTKEMVASMAREPIIFAMANPDPEITPDEVREIRQDAIIATGRSDYNNQVNNVMGFPYIFRGALDVRARIINDEMKIAAAKALAALARQSIPDEVSMAYAGRKMSYGPDYIIPAPFDPRLITTIPVSVAEAAIKTGVSRLEQFDLIAYRKELSSRLNPSAHYMNSVFERITGTDKKIVFAEGEHETAIKAAISMRDNNYAKPILVGREQKITPILEGLGEGYHLEGIEVVNAATIGDKLDYYTDVLYKKLQRKGFIYRDCSKLVKSDRNIFASLMIECGDADAMVTGLQRSFNDCLEDVLKVIDSKYEEVFSYAVMIEKEKNILIADTNVHEKPCGKTLANIAKKMAQIVGTMGEKPAVAFLSSRNFNQQADSNIHIGEALALLTQENVEFEFDGPMTATVALDPNLRSIYPFCRLSKPANILIMPDLNSAAISTRLLQQMGSGTFIGPVITGLGRAVQIAQMGSSASQLITLASIAVAGAVEKIH